MDPEQQSTRLDRAFLGFKRRWRWTKSQPLFQLYWKLFWGLLLVYVLRWITPQAVIDDLQELDLAAPPRKYSNLLPFIQYNTILENPVLKHKLAFKSSLQSVIVPDSMQEMTSTVDSLRIAKELNVVHTELARIAREYGFDCVPSIAIGLEFNVFFLVSTDTLMINARLDSPLPAYSPLLEEIQVENVFGETQHLLVSRDETPLMVSYIDKYFHQVERKEISASSEKICLIYYFQNFHFIS